MTLGFLGTGAITEAIVTGLDGVDGRPAIRLSPRNAEVARRLARQFDNVTVCASNQEVLDGSETIVVAVRPQVVEEALSGLGFSARHNVVSLVAGFSTRRIAALVSPADRIWRAIPLPSVAQRRCPIAVYPPEGLGVELFAPIGQVFGMDSEDHLNAFSTATSTMAAYFRFLGQIASWAAGKGIREAQAREYVARMFAGLNDAGLKASHRSFEELAAAHATRGGLNEQVMRDLADHGVYDALTDALDSVHRRAAAT